MILNLGCGNELLGDVRVDIIQTNATTHVMDLSLPWKFQSGLFDEVYSRNLLEHLPNPQFFFREAFRVLKRKGKLTLITDNAACLKYYVLGTHTGGYVGGSLLSRSGFDRHYSVFTMEHLRNHLELACFKILEMKLIDTQFFTKRFDKVVRWFAPSLSYPRIYVEAMKW